MMKLVNFLFMIVLSMLSAQAEDSNIAEPIIPETTLVRDDYGGIPCLPGWQSPDDSTWKKADVISGWGNCHDPEIGGVNSEKKSKHHSSSTSNSNSRNSIARIELYFAPLQSDFLHITGASLTRRLSNILSQFCSVCIRSA